MIRAFAKFISWLKSLWRTLVRMLVKSKHIRVEDVDQDGVNEIVIDLKVSSDTPESIKGGN